MSTLILVIALLIVLVFGVVSAMSAYASARQADAVIETARVAQVNAVGNLITILALIFAIVLLVALIVAALWWMSQKNRSRAYAGYNQRAPVQVQTPPVDINMLMQLEMLRTLRSFHQPTQPLLTDGNADEAQGEQVDFPQWLRR